MTRLSGSIGFQFSESVDIGQYVAAGTDGNIIAA
jgi:hypothetical protein